MVNMKELQSLGFTRVEEGEEPGRSWETSIRQEERRAKGESTRVSAVLVADGPSLTNIRLFKDFIQLSFGNKSFSMLSRNFC